MKEKDNKRCCIFGAGDFYDDGITIKKGDLVIAADGGYDHLKNTSIIPHVVLGDFDSVSPEFDEKKSGFNIMGINIGLKKENKYKIIRYSSEKDETDMMLAVKYGLDRGYDRFYLYGAAGGRLSHTLANIQLLVKICENNATGYVIDKNMVITAVKDGEIEFDNSYKGLVSVFSHSDISKNVKIKGLKYELNGEDLKNDNATGISNEFLEKPGTTAKISVEKGILIIVIEK